MIETTEIKNNDIQSNTNNKGTLTEWEKSASHSSTISWTEINHSLKINPKKESLKRITARLIEIK
jgi:hypothetical protein